MSTSQDEEYDVSEEPILEMYFPPSSQAEQSQRRSPIVPVVSSPGLRLYLSPSFARRRNSPSVRNSPLCPANAHTSATRRPPNVVASTAGAHTSADATGPPTRSRKRKLTSDIWDDFTPIYDDNGKLVEGQCIHCETIFPTSKRSGSSQCRRHRLTCTEKAKLDELIGTIQPGDARIPAIKRFKYDRDKALDELVRMIVLHELPFRIVEYVGFRRFVASLNPAFKLMSRTTIRDECIAEFNRQKTQLLEVLKNLNSRVSLTADLWTSNQELGYICVTCHFVDNKWNLHKRIINFAHVETPHNATNLLNVMLKTMEDWGIDDKICSITLDNASVNDLMVSYIKSNLIGRRLLAGNGDIFHHRCAAHVLNLIVQEGLKVSCGAIDAIRESVKFVRSSAQRKENFDKIITQLGITCEKQLALDVSTRWNSTYLMMKTASEYIAAFAQLAVQDLSFKCAPSASQWTIAEEICKLLVVFYDATVVVSGSLYPTSNAYFKMLWRVKWTLEKEASNENATIRSMVLHMKKFLKYWKLSFLTMCIPIILDPRCKVEFLNYNLKDDTEVEGPKYLAIVKRKFKEMLSAYSSQQIGDSGIQNLQENQASSSSDPWARWSQHVGQRKQRTKQSEYDMYLKDDLVPPDVEIDVLEWWMTNGHKYPTIARMARDVLAVPASTVASESAFSTGSRVISDYRSRLASETVTALICLQDWMRPSGVIDSTTIVEDLDNEDEMLRASTTFRVERNETQVDS